MMEKLKKRNISLKDFVLFISRLKMSKRQNNGFLTSGCYLNNLKSKLLKEKPEKHKQPYILCQ